MKKTLVLAAILAVAAISAQAAVVYWAGDYSGVGGVGNYSYTNGTRWTADLSTQYGTPPLSTDSHGLITFAGTVTVWPVIDTAIPAGNVPETIGVGWDNGDGTLNIADGGSINIGTMYIGLHSTGTVNMTAGYMVGGPVTLGYPAGSGGGMGVINQSGGVIHLASIAWYDGVVNLSDTAFFLINGDQTGLDLVGNGWITAPAGKIVAENYNSVDDRTEYTVIP